MRYGRIVGTITVAAVMVLAVGRAGFSRSRSCVHSSMVRSGSRSRMWDIASQGAWAASLSVSARPLPRRSPVLPFTRHEEMPGWALSPCVRIHTPTVSSGSATNPSLSPPTGPVSILQRFSAWAASVRLTRSATTRRPTRSSARSASRWRLRRVSLGRRQPGGYVHHRAGGADDTHSLRCLAVRGRVPGPHRRRAVTAISQIHGGSVVCGRGRVTPRRDARTREGRVRFSPVDLDA